MVPAAGGTQPFVGVFRVGAGNCIGLFDRTPNLTCFVDFGFPLNANKSTYPGYVAGGGWAPGPAGRPEVNSNPVIVLSHWDYDHSAMCRHVNGAYQCNWIAPQQAMGSATARLIYMQVLANGQLSLWTVGPGGGGIMTTPWGFIERAAGPPADANETGLVAYVALNDPGIGWPAASAGWPGAALAAPAVGAVVGPPVGGVPAAGGLPAAGALGGPLNVNLGALGGLPAPGGGGLAPFRFALMPGDASFPNLPNVAAVQMVGLVAPHHGSGSWMTGAQAGAMGVYYGALAGPGGGLALPPYPKPDLTRSTAALLAAGGAAPAALGGLAIPAVPGGVPESLQAALGNYGGAPGLMAPAPQPFLVGGGRIAYSYGVRPNGNHPYHHPSIGILTAYGLSGWASRLDTPANFWDPATNNALTYPNWDGATAIALAPPVPRSAPAIAGASFAGVALGWQDVPGGGGGQTYLTNDTVAGAAAAAGGPIQRNRIGADAGNPPYRFHY
jgi:hypothetical protein